MRAESQAHRRQTGPSWAAVAVLMIATSMLGGCALAMLNGAASSGGSASAPPPHNSADDAISTAVRSKLATDPNVRSFILSVDTHDGVVTLRGQVANVGQRNDAGADARAVKGVKSVKNLITVKQ